MSERNADLAQDVLALRTGLDMGRSLNDAPEMYAEGRRLGCRNGAG